MPTQKYSVVDAAQLALTAAPVRATKATDAIVLGAARVWCRQLSIPTVRAIGAEVGRSPVTVLHPFGGMLELYAEVIRREWDLLTRRWFAPSPDEAWSFLEEHALALARECRALLRLPAFVHAAMTSVLARHPDGEDRAVALYVVAASAAKATPVDAAARCVFECNTLAWRA